MCQGSGTSPPGPRRVGTETSERSKLASCPQQHHTQLQGQGSRGTLFSPPASLKTTVPSTQQPQPLPSVREGSFASLGLFTLRPSFFRFQSASPLPFPGFLSQPKSQDLLCFLALVLAFLPTFIN